MTVGPDYSNPSGELPDAWSRSVANDLKGGPEALEGWWKGFNDPTLSGLIDRARESSPTLQAASERIQEARAQRGIAASQGLPQSTMDGGYSRNRSSEALLVPAPPQNPSNFYSSGFDAGWEIDLFGGIRRSVEAAEANIGAREEDYRDTLVTLFSDVALNYVEYRTLEQRIAVAESNIAAQRASVQLTQNRLDAGLVPKIDVTQAQTNLALSESLIPSLKAQLVYARNRLSTLTGGFPGSLDSMLGKPRAIPLPKAGYSAGLPANLVRSRPDIRRAERELASQTALIGVAESDLYPRFTLFGDFRLQAADSGNLFNSSSRSYSFGPSFQWQVFSAGRIRNAIAAEDSRANQAYSAYENAVLRAVEEVENGMAGIAYERERLEVISRAVAASRETVNLIKDNYEKGLVNFQNVLDAERTKFDTEDQEIISRGQISKNYIILYKALGGGTETELIPGPPVKANPSMRKQQPAH
ncbi:MAG: efflux transporter outer membrane subunit [Verrucomicrobiae bacterium]|nr:efflux transporter outer membrane subunit [Verrucomicrobiae bacterium]